MGMNLIFLLNICQACRLCIIIICNYSCINENCNDHVFYSKNEFYFKNDVNSILHCDIEEEKTCPNCKKVENIRKMFENTPSWLFIQALYKYNTLSITVHDLPASMIINDLKYSLFCCTFNVKVIDKGH